MKSFKEIVLDATNKHRHSLADFIGNIFVELAIELDERFPVTQKPQDELNDSKRVDWEQQGE